MTLPLPLDATLGTRHRRRDATGAAESEGGAAHRCDSLERAGGGEGYAGFAALLPPCAHTTKLPAALQAPRRERRR